MFRTFILAQAVLFAGVAAAQDVRVNDPASVVVAKPVPVTAGDITDRPYRVLGLVRVTVVKNSRFGKPVTEEKIYKELWERGARMGADAVILAESTAPDADFIKRGSREASGRAIKFVEVQPGSLPR